MTAHDHTALIHDLVTADGRRLSPFCWAAKLALAHKGVPFATVPTRFVDIPTIGGGGFKTVPVIELGPDMIGDSFELALKLEHAFPDRPTLFAGPGGVALTRYASANVSYLIGKVARVLAADICGALDEETQGYFRATREKALGGTLEDVCADRAGGVAAVQDALRPLRIMLRGQPFIGGEEPLFADFLIAGVVQWTRVVGVVDFLEGEQAIAEWFGRIETRFEAVLGATKG